MIIRTPSIYFYLEKISVQSLSNKFIQISGNANIQFPSYLNLTIDNQQIISIRVKRKKEFILLINSY